MIALGNMRNVPQWFIWRLTWNSAEGKFDKVPCFLDGSAYRMDASLPENWNTYERAVQVIAALPVLPELRYALGFWLTAECGYWFLDLDNAKGNPWAEQLVACYPGAFFEWSSSGKGMHVIGRGAAPYDHYRKPPKEIADRLLPLKLEFYTQARGIAFGLTGDATGCADLAFDVTPLCDAYFPPRPVAAEHDGPRADWRGPADDDVLVERMLRARTSAAAAFGGKPSLLQLWQGAAEHNSENDLALAAHLAFWTGCDQERMLRLMQRSGMRRDKWIEHRTYLTLTIEKACSDVRNVYQEPVRDLTPMYGTPEPQAQITTQVAGEGGGERISAELFARVECLLAEVASCGTELELHNVVIPKITEAGVPRALQERLSQSVKRKLDFWDNKQPIGQVRAMLFPPAVKGAGHDGLPDWAKDYCFVLNGDRFFNLTNATFTTMVGFQAAFGRLMPMGDGGRRQSAPEQCLHFWGMPIVEQVGYRPDCGEYFEWEGVRFANRYTPASLPAVATEWTDAGLAGIREFQALLWDMCGRREAVYYSLLYWYAHNVQRPGVKIRWAPIVKGINGDGKTLATTVLRASMGFRNVSITGNAALTASGGFTDWFIGGAVNVIEEIMLVGKARHQLYNAIKEPITNNVINVNPKGATTFSTWNCTNHYANTNHNDALPLESTDRRWFVVFTPWSSEEDMLNYMGLDLAGWKRRTDSIDHAIKHCAGELRAWFLGVNIPETFDINGRAPMTAEKSQMMASSTDNVESAAADIIEAGGVGITNTVLSSSQLTLTLNIRAQVDGLEVPKGMALNHMLTRLGFSKFSKVVKWNNKTHTIWLKNGVNYDTDRIRTELDRTLVSVG